jgi:hypothetical protein
MLRARPGADKVARLFVLRQSAPYGWMGTAKAGRMGV